MDATVPWNLTIWLPALFLLGLVVMGLMFAFIAAHATRFERIAQWM